MRRLEESSRIVYQGIRRDQKREEGEFRSETGRGALIIMSVCIPPRCAQGIAVQPRYPEDMCGCARDGGHLSLASLFPTKLRSLETLAQDSLPLKFLVRAGATSSSTLAGEIGRDARTSPPQCTHGISCRLPH